MPFAIPQTTFNLYPTNAYLGQLYRTAENTENCRSLPALYLVKAGDLLERLYDSTSKTYSVRAAQSASGALVALAGVAIYKSAKGGGPSTWAGVSTPSDYQIGEQVTFVRRGMVFAKWLSAAGAAQAYGTTPNYAHSSTAGTGSQAGGTTTTTNGAFTDAATATTAGAEVDVCPSSIVLGEDQTGVDPSGTGLGQFTAISSGMGICLVSLNLP
jgi:hypothetical protein